MANTFGIKKGRGRPQSDIKIWKVQNVVPKGYGFMKVRKGKIYFKKNGI
jgi:hypothetical protein